MEAGTMNTNTSADTSATTPSEGSRRSVSFLAGTFFAAFAASVAGLFLVLPFGLIASEYVILPLAMGVAGVLGTIAASWAGNYMAGDGTRTHLYRTAAAVETAAAVIAGVVLIISAIRGSLFGPWFYIALVCSVLLAAAAASAVGRFRVPAGSGFREWAQTGLLFLIAVVAIPATLFVAWLLGLTGA
jgi:hypothetical protein